MNEKYTEVEAWLQNILPGRSVPRYELNEITLDILSELMNRNTQLDKSARLIIEDLNQKSIEYSAECAIGIRSVDLSQNAMMNLNTLVSVSVLLGVQAPSTTNLLLALNELTEDKLCIADQLQTARKHSASLSSKTKSQLQCLSMLSSALEEADACAERQKENIKEKSDISQFLRTKTIDYRRNIDELKKKFDTAGADSAIFHRTLVKKSEELEVQQEKLRIIKAKLDSYHALPPDVSLAKVKIQEVKRDLAALELDLTQRIDLLQM